MDTVKAGQTQTRPPQHVERPGPVVISLGSRSLRAGCPLPEVRGRSAAGQSLCVARAQPVFPGLGDLRSLVVASPAGRSLGAEAGSGESLSPIRKSQD